MQCDGYTIYTYAIDGEEINVKINKEGFVTHINSDIFISDFTDWEKIDEGYGDKFAHAQNLYFDKPLIDEQGNYIIKLKF